MAARGSITLQWVPIEVYKGAADPENPEDGQLVINTSDNVLKRWDATAGAYVVLTDYNAMAAQLGEIQQVTTSNQNFLKILQSLKVTDEGIILEGINGVFKQVIGPAETIFYESGAEILRLSGSSTIVPTLQVLKSLQIGGTTFIGTEHGYIKK